MVGESSGFLGEPDVTRSAVEATLPLWGAWAYFAGSGTALQSRLLIPHEATTALAAVIEAEFVGNRRKLASRGGITVLAILRQLAWTPIATRWSGCGTGHHGAGTQCGLISAVPAPAIEAFQFRRT